MIFFLPFIATIGKLLVPQLIRTAVPVLASSIVQRFAPGPPVAPQRAAYYEDEEFEEFEEDEEFEEEEEE